MSCRPDTELGQLVTVFNCRLQSMGSPEQAAAMFLENIVAPPGSDKTAKLIGAASRWDALFREPWGIFSAPWANSSSPCSQMGEGGAATVTDFMLGYEHAAKGLSRELALAMCLAFPGPGPE
jgi:hypothetical protein